MKIQEIIKWYESEIQKIVATEVPIEEKKKKLTALAADYEEKVKSLFPTMNSIEVKKARKLFLKTNNKDRKPLKVMSSADSGEFTFETKDPPRVKFKLPQFENWKVEVYEREVRYLPEFKNDNFFKYPPSIIVSDYIKKDEVVWWKRILKGVTESNPVRFKMLKKYDKAKGRFYFSVEHKDKYFEVYLEDWDDKKNGFFGKKISNSILNSLDVMD